MLQSSQTPRRKRPRSALRRRLRQITASPAFITIAGTAVAAYLRVVRGTSRFIIDPPNAYDAIDPNLPVIVTMWHGQHFLMPFLRRKHDRASVLISRHGDGAINAVAARKLGVDVIRGSGGRDPSRSQEKGAVTAFLALRRTLARGVNVALTADISRGEARRAGLGIIILSRATGRPIVPVAFATSNRKEVESWDSSTLNLPFSRMACVMGPLIWVPAEADDAALEAKRLEVEHGLNRVTERAYAIVDKRDV